MGLDKRLIDFARENQEVSTVYRSNSTYYLVVNKKNDGIEEKIRDLGLELNIISESISLVPIRKSEVKEIPAKTRIYQKVI